ncbi:hypothetical protein, partial [Atlantibacter hermannii]|uniref:hypothetical protein n=1 Tax=Atlantibacter hermannii TaxID=565 RepID=UPI0034D4F463
LWPKPKSAVKPIPRLALHNNQNERTKPATLRALFILWLSFKTIQQMLNTVTGIFMISSCLQFRLRLSILF